MEQDLVLQLTLKCTQDSVKPAEGPATGGSSCAAISFEFFLNFGRRAAQFTVYQYVAVRSYTQFTDSYDID